MNAIITSIRSRLSSDLGLNIIFAVLVLMIGSTSWSGGAQAAATLVLIGIGTVYSSWIGRPLRPAILLLRLSLALLVLLLPAPEGIVRIGNMSVTHLLLGALLAWLPHRWASITLGLNEQLFAAGANQFLATWVIFLASALWHWPTPVILLLVAGVSYYVAKALLLAQEDRASEVLALAWALIAAEAGWVFSHWLVNYVVAGGQLILPQPALVIGAVGYCFGGIYVAHLTSKLSRARLVEYLAIGLAALIIVIVGTKWSGSI